MAEQELDLDRYNDRAKPGTPLAGFACWAVVAPVPTLRIALGIVLEELGRRADEDDPDVRAVAEIVRRYRKARDVDERTEDEIEALLALQERLLARWPEVAGELPDGL